MKKSRKHVRSISGAPRERVLVRNLKTPSGEWKWDSIVDLYRHVRMAVGAVKDDEMRKECDGMCRFRGSNEISGMRWGK
jgi:hypothetical protein